MPIVTIDSLSDFYANILTIQSKNLSIISPKPKINKNIFILAR